MDRVDILTNIIMLASCGKNPKASRRITINCNKLFKEGFDLDVEEKSSVKYIWMRDGEIETIEETDYVFVNGIKINFNVDDKFYIPIILYVERQRDGNN